MKKIVGLTIAAIIVMALAGGGTLAFFSDTEKSQDNLVQAGSLYLALNNSAFFQVSSDYNNIKPGNTHDEYLTLTPGGSIATGNRLSIQMKNEWVDKSGFTALVTPTPKLHKLSDGSAYVDNDAGDFGKAVKMVMWLSTATPTNNPAGADKIILPGKNGGGMGTFTSVFTGFTDWATIWSNGGITNYNYAGYINVTNSPFVSTPSEEYHWNDVLGADMGSTPWYFHVTFNFPNGDSTDNIYQAEKVATDLYFTLATSASPY